MTVAELFPLKVYSFVSNKDKDNGLSSVKIERLSL